MGRKYSVGYDKLAVEHQHKQQVLFTAMPYFSTRKITHIYIFKKIDLLLEMLCLCVTLRARDDYIIFCSYYNSGRCCDVALTLAVKTLGGEMNRACSCVITRMKKKAAQIIKKKNPTIVYQWVGSFIKGAKIPRGLNHRSVLRHLQSKSTRCPCSPLFFSKMKI